MRILSAAYVCPALSGHICTADEKVRECVTLENVTFMGDGYD